ncbi:Tfp pilus assembly protein PilF [Herbihabitans rhizosphaerae]|uniref:Tfp pilus assembly protein PilF n=1 Tax=Herbihabitans rhizosphaerae TaxID=1872711 RepID=A0A4Q7KBP6_9PSEU|nr:tetratricopeptide repeat protein [Herbihabitans rhizosphaerae]RZS30388.1 Tfp pilus assembly protein PilF [Herbihabitans rhizosphaerae]
MKVAVVASLAVVLLRAAELTADGEPKAAIALLRPTVARYPDHPEAWCRLAAAYLDAGEPSESLDAAKAAMRLGERSWAHRLASLALIELGRDDEAVVSAREAARRDPADWRCHVTLAQALRRKESEHSLAAARRAVDLAPDEARTHEVLGDSALAAQQWSQARTAFTEAVRLDPENGHARESLTKLAGVAPVRATPRAPGRPTAPTRLGRAQLTALWLVVRRAGVWLGAGAFVLLIAGMPEPSTFLAWFGLLSLVLVLGVLGQGWRSLPHSARVTPRVLLAGRPALAAAVGLLALGLIVLAVWTAALALGARGLQALPAVLVCGLLAAGLGWLAVSRTARR